LLSADNVSVSYGKFEAVKGVSLSLNRGELVTIIGANGAGKTSLLRAISGLLKPNKGKIFFENEEITSLSIAERVKRGIVYCPEGRKLFPYMTVTENLEMGAYTCSGDFKNNLEKVVSLFPILRIRKTQLAGSLSGGEQQMLAIGRTLMANPQLVLFDEPSTGLSPIITEELMAVIKKLNEGGMTVLLVEQNVEFSLDISQRGYVIENGKIVLEGTAFVLKRNEEVKRCYLGG